MSSQSVNRLFPINPDAQLANAQFALARDYGFASWPDLNAYVEAEMETLSPFAGKWVANLLKSQRHPAGWKGPRIIETEAKRMVRSPAGGNMRSRRIVKR